MIKLYGIKNCDSVKKAIRYCKAHELEYELIDLKEHPVDEKKIRHWLQQIPLSRLFNSRSTSYRTLGLKALNLDDTGKINWLSQENLLIKRPVLEYHDTILVGYDENMYQELLHS